MEVAEAVKAAKSLVAEIFADEEPTHIGLEEVELTDGIWSVTIGFSRPWNVAQRSALAALTTGQPIEARRSFKVVKIRDADGQMMGIKQRPSLEFAP